MEDESRSLLRREVRANNGPGNWKKKILQRDSKRLPLTADNYATKKGENIFEITRGEQWGTMASLLDAFSS